MLLLYLDETPLVPSSSLKVFLFSFVVSFLDPLQVTAGGVIGIVLAWAFVLTLFVVWIVYAVKQHKKMQRKAQTTGVPIYLPESDVEKITEQVQKIQEEGAGFNIQSARKETIKLIP